MTRIAPHRRVGAIPRSDDPAGSERAVPGRARAVEFGPGQGILGRYSVPPLRAAATLNRLAGSLVEPDHF